MSGKGVTRARPQGMAALALGALLLGAAGASPDGDEAVASALAARTLLLDAVHAGDRIVAVGVYGHVVLSDDEGGTWRQAARVPTRTTLTGVHFVDARRGWAVGHDAVVIHTKDGGETWSLQHRDVELDAPLFSIRLDAAGRGLAVGAYGLALATDDGGASWRRTRVCADDEDLHLNALFAGAGEARFIAAEAGEVYRSQDRGATWTRTSTGYPGSLWGGLALESGRLLVFGMRGHVLASDDSGERWEMLPRASDQSLGGGAELASGEVLLAGLSGSLLLSRDGGRSFMASTRPGREAANAVLALRDGGALLLGAGGAVRLSPAEIAALSADRDGS